RFVERALELGALGEEAEKRMPDQAARPGGQQVLRGGIGIAHDVIVIQHDDRRGEQVQAGERSVGHSHPLELRRQRLWLAISRRSASMFFWWPSTASWNGLSRSSTRA